MRKPAFCICKNKDADQRNCTADQCLCFHFLASTIPLLPKSEISSLSCVSYLFSVDFCGCKMSTNIVKASVIHTFLAYSLARVRCAGTWSDFTLRASLYQCSASSSLFRAAKTSPTKLDVSLVVRKLVFGVSDKVRHKLGCTAKEDG